MQIEHKSDVAFVSGPQGNLACLLLAMQFFSLSSGSDIHTAIIKIFFRLAVKISRRVT